MSGRGRGRLIALEGIDGSGKSTQARLLSDHLGAVRSFEPGATVLGASLRRLVLDPAQPAVTGRAEALLMAADRAQHVAEVIEPALQAGTWVVTDRFAASTLAYQGYGRGMPVEELEWLVAWATCGLRADLNVLIDVPVTVAAVRRAGGADDRFEGLGDGFQQRVADGFHRMASEQPEAWSVVDGTRSVADVADDVLSSVQSRLGEPARG